MNPVWVSYNGLNLRSASSQSPRGWCSHPCGDQDLFRVSSFLESACCPTSAPFFCSRVSTVKKQPDYYITSCPASLPWGQNSRRLVVIQCPTPPLPKSALLKKRQESCSPCPPRSQESSLKDSAPIARDLETQAKVGSADPGGPIWANARGSACPSPPWGRNSSRFGTQTIRAQNSKQPLSLHHNRHGNWGESKWGGVGC